MSVSRIEWKKVFPILHLWQAVRMGFRLRILLPALLLTGLFSAGIDWLDADFEGPRVTVSSHWVTYRSCSTVLPKPIHAIVRSASAILTNRSGSTLLKRFEVLLGTMLLLAFFGTAIARSTATNFCRNEKTGPLSALRFSLRHWGNGLLSLSLAVGISALPLLAVALASWAVGDAGATGIAGVFWPAIFLCSLCSVLTAIVCGVAWLLSLAAVATDRCPGSDALSRGINYVLSHKTYTVLLLAGVCVISSASSILMELVLQCGSAVMHRRFSHGMNVNLTRFSGQWSFGGFSQTLFNTLPQAVHLGVFFAGVTIAYILLRQREDAVHLNELSSAADEA